MAKQRTRRTSQKRTSSSRSSENTTGQQARSSRSGSGSKFFDKLKDFYENPAVRYIATGLAAAAVTKTIQTMSERYPEISDLLRNTFDSIEDKLVEFKESTGGGRSVARNDSNLQH